MASATKGELVQLGHDLRERVRQFCAAHGMQDADGVPLLLAATYYLAKHTSAFRGDGAGGSFVPRLAQVAVNVFEQIDRAEAVAGRPGLHVLPAKLRDVGT